MNQTDNAVKASLFVTCIIDQFFPEVGEAAVRVLRRLGVDVEFDQSQTCCGQPAFNSGDWKSGRKVARHTASIFGGDLPVIVPSGSCAAMNFHGNRLQFEEEPDEAVESLSNRTWELMDFIVNGLGVTEWEGSLENPTKIAFHHSCHSRGTKTGEATTQLLQSIENVELVSFAPPPTPVPQPPGNPAPERKFLAIIKTFVFDEAAITDGPLHSPTQSPSYFFRVVVTLN